MFVRWLFVFICLWMVASAQWWDNDIDSDDMWENGWDDGLGDGWFGQGWLSQGWFGGGDDGWFGGDSDGWGLWESD